MRAAEPEPDAGSSPDRREDSAGTAAPASPAESAQSNACSEGMQLVDGEYCSEVEQTCLKSWYDRPNQKEICERFAAPSRCTGQRLHKRFCIDRYEWPNRAGERPEVMNTFYQAQVKCAAVGKRMCTESEWTFGCEGPEMKPYPYGYERDANKCNGDRPWDHPDMNAVAKRSPGELARLWQGVRSGSQPACVSDFGVHDLPGNADEVASTEGASTDGASASSRARHDNVTTGGPWYLGVRNQCRPKIYTHDEGFYYYYLGFRCCGEADGNPTDPRAPKQLEAKVSFGYVERMARFSVKQVQEKLLLKSEGKCTCAERDITCKTLCGTLLGPDARDALPR
jgi:formylglycine-generating enzyme